MRGALFIRKAKRRKLDTRFVEKLRKEFVVLQTHDLDRDDHAFKHDDERVPEHRYDDTARRADHVGEHRNDEREHRMRERKRADAQKAHRIRKVGRNHFDEFDDARNDEGADTVFGDGTLSVDETLKGFSECGKEHEHTDHDKVEARRRLMEKQNAHDERDDVPKKARAGKPRLSEKRAAGFSHDEFIRDIDYQTDRIDEKADGDRNAEHRKHRRRVGSRRHELYDGRVRLSEQSCHPIRKRLEQRFVRKKLARQKSHDHTARSDCDKDGRGSVVRADA